MAEYPTARGAGLRLHRGMGSSLPLTLAYFIRYLLKTLIQPEIMTIKNFKSLNNTADGTISFYSKLLANRFQAVMSQFSHKKNSDAPGFVEHAPFRFIQCRPVLAIRWNDLFGIFRMPLHM